MSSKIHFSLLEREIMQRPGYEYLVIFRVEHRSRAMESLGRCPLFGEVRDYVRESEVDLLSAEGCRQNIVVVVEDYLVLTDRPALCHPDDVWQFWVEIFFLPHEQLETDEYELLSCTFGDAVIYGRSGRHSGDYSASLQSYVEKKPQFVNSLILKSLSVGEVADMQEIVCEHVLEEHSVSLFQFQESVAAVQRAPVLEDSKSKDGYCYEALFPVHFRSIVRGWLGINPMVDKLIDVLLVFRRFDLLDDCDTRLALKEVSASVMHIDSGGSNAYAVMHDLVDSYARGFRGIVGADIPADVNKRFCDVCGFWVNPHDHELRCAVSPTGDHVRKIWLRRRAWLGDDRHRMDVRQVILCSNVLPGQYEIEAQKYTEGTKQAQWYRSYDGPKVPPLGSSDASFASAFEASYVGEFRRDYIRYLLAQYTDYNLPCDVADMIVDDKSELVVLLQVCFMMLREVKV